LFHIYSKKLIICIGGGIFLVLCYLYLANELLLFSSRSNITWTSNYDDMVEVEEASTLFWYFWIVKLLNVLVTKFEGDRVTTKGVYFLLFWFLNIKFEVLSMNQLVILLIIECLKSSTYLIMKILDKLKSYEHYHSWVFETIGSYIFLSCYMSSSRYPMFAYMAMAFFSPYAMIVLFFLGM
jgi:hypothetical protein